VWRKTSGVPQILAKIALGGLEEGRSNRGWPLPRVQDEIGFFDLGKGSEWSAEALGPHPAMADA